MKEEEKVIIMDVYHNSQSFAIVTMVTYYWWGQE